MNQKVSLIAGSLLIISAMTVAGVVINTSGQGFDQSAAVGTALRARPEIKPALVGKEGKAMVTGQDGAETADMRPAQEKDGPNLLEAARKFCAILKDTKPALPPKGDPRTVKPQPVKETPVKNTTNTTDTTDTTSSADTTTVN